MLWFKKKPAKKPPLPAIVESYEYGKATYVAEQIAQCPGPANGPALAGTGFDPTKARERFSAAYHILQRSWSTGDLLPIRSFVTDALYERLTIAAAENHALGLSPAFTDIRIHACELGAHRTEGTLEQLTVAFVVDGRHEVTSLQSKAEIYAGHAVFCELWTLIRRLGASQVNGEGLMEGACPQCHAPLAMSQHANCAHCGIAVRSGSHDWVLSEIIQSRCWHPPKPSDTRVEAYQEKDPEFATPILLDRASLIFWRILAASRGPGAAPLGKITDTAFLQRFEAEKNEGKWPRTNEVVVGSVELIDLVPVNDSFDEARVAVTWQGAKGDFQQSFRTILSLKRKSGVRSLGARERGTGRCHGCGGPIDFGVQATCAFCGALLNDGQTDWVLAGIAEEQITMMSLADLGTRAGMTWRPAR